jgi:hypothetical protein
MSRITVWIVSPPGSLHSRCFEEVALALASGLREIGHESQVVASERAPAGRSVVLGAHLLAGADPFALPAGCVLFNLEQVGDDATHLPPRYFELLRHFPVLDYSQSNVEALRKHGVRARLCGLGYAPELTRIAPAEEDIDVLFYGSVNERRARVIVEMRRRGLRVEAAFGVYGEERDRLAARAKVVLNVHFHQAKLFEAVRVSYLLANRRCVLSEVGCDPALERPFAGGVAFERYERLPDAAVELADDGEKRRQVAEAGFRLFSSVRQADCLRQVEGQLVTPPSRGVRHAESNIH